MPTEKYSTNTKRSFIHLVTALPCLSHAKSYVRVWVCMCICGRQCICLSSIVFSYQTRKLWALNKYTHIISFGTEFPSAQHVSLALGLTRKFRINYKMESYRMTSFVPFAKRFLCNEMCMFVRLITPIHMRIRNDAMKANNRHVDSSSYYLYVYLCLCVCIFTLVNICSSCMCLYRVE